MIYLLLAIWSQFPVLCQEDGHFLLAFRSHDPAVFIVHFPSVVKPVTNDGTCQETRCHIPTYPPPTPAILELYLVAPAKEGAITVERSSERFTVSLLTDCSLLFSPPRQPPP